MKKTPRRLRFDEQAVKLSRLENFVLARCDGRLSVMDLVQLTGLAEPQVEQIITKLETEGAIELSEAGSEPQLDALLADEPLADAAQILLEVPGGLDDAPSS